MLQGFSMKTDWKTHLPRLSKNLNQHICSNRPISLPLRLLLLHTNITVFEEFQNLDGSVFQESFNLNWLHLNCLMGSIIWKPKLQIISSVLTHNWSLCRHACMIKVHIHLSCAILAQHWDKWSQERKGGEANCQNFSDARNTYVSAVIKYCESKRPAFRMGFK